MVCQFFISQYALLSSTLVTSCRGVWRGGRSKAPAASSSPARTARSSSPRPAAGKAPRNLPGRQGHRRGGRRCRRRRRCGCWRGRPHRRNFAEPSWRGGEAGWRAGNGGDRCSLTSSDSSTLVLLSSDGRTRREPASLCKPDGFAVPPPGSWSSPLAGGRGGAGAQFLKGYPLCCSMRRRLGRAQTKVERRSC